VRVWIDISNSPQVLFFRPLIALLRKRGHDVSVTTRDYAQTIDLLALHRIEHEVVGPRHGGPGAVGKARAMASRLRALRRYARGRGLEVALSHASHELPKPEGGGHQAGGAAGAKTAAKLPDTVAHDPTLQDPRCVFQLLKKQYSRYTPEVVERITGIPKDQFLKAADLFTSIRKDGDMKKAATIIYAVGWTQHTFGTQIIRAAAILQLLMDNALKFSKAKIEVSAEPMGEHVRIAVKDFGIGIARDQLEAFFKSPI